VPIAFIIAGPNGAGKTTFARRFLQDEVECRHFLNADLIAAGLSPLNPALVGIEAGRLLLKRLDRIVVSGEDFLLESTLSGVGYVLRFKQWRQAGYYIVLVYLKIPSAEFSVQRIADRVSKGGHHIPEVDAHRRFGKSWRNFQNHYLALADEWTVIDNTEDPPVVLESSK